MLLTADIASPYSALNPPGCQSNSSTAKRFNRVPFREWKPGEAASENVGIRDIAGVGSDDDHFVRVHCETGDGAIGFLGVGKFIRGRECRREVSC